MDKRGFTLLELTISMSVLTVIFLLSFLALQSARAAMAASSAKARVQDNLRDVMSAVRTEVQLAAKASDNTLVPPLTKIAINAAPAPKCPTEIVFQRPRDASGKLWTSAIRYRYYNEDTNGNSILDPGEDANSDKMLSRTIQRIQDVNGDGDTANPGEINVVGGGNDLSNVVFTLNGNVVTVQLTSTQLVPGHYDRPVRMSLTSDVYLQN